MLKGRGAQDISVIAIYCLHSDCVLNSPLFGSLVDPLSFCEVRFVLLFNSESFIFLS